MSGAPHEVLGSFQPGWRTVGLAAPFGASAAWTAPARARAHAASIRTARMMTSQSVLWPECSLGGAYTRSRDAGAVTLGNDHLADRAARGELVEQGIDLGERAHRREQPLHREAAGAPERDVAWDIAARDGRAHVTAHQRLAVADEGDGR